MLTLSIKKDDSVTMKNSSNGFKEHMQAIQLSSEIHVPPSSTREVHLIFYISNNLYILVMHSTVPVWPMHLVSMRRQKERFCGY